MNKTSNRITFSSNAPVKFDANAKNKTPGSIGTLIGAPILWNQLSTDRGGYKVKLAPNSATFATPTFALFAHEFANVLGSTANNSLRIMPAVNGFDAEIDLPDTTLGNDVKTLVENGYVSGMSFTMANGFEDSFSSTEADGQKVLNATKYTVDEVSIVANPAFTATSIALQPSDVLSPATPGANAPADQDDEEDGEIVVTPTGGMSSEKTKERIRHALKIEQYRLTKYRL